MKGPHTGANGVRGPDGVGRPPRPSGGGAATPAATASLLEFG